MNMQKQPPVNLDTLVQPAGEVALRGRTYTVHPIDGRSFQLVANMSGGMEAVAAMYRVAALCVPDMSEEDVKSLNQEQIKAVVEIASGAVRAVESAAGNPSTAGAKRTRRTPSPA